MYKIIILLFFFLLCGCVEMEVVSDKEQYNTVHKLRYNRAELADERLRVALAYIAAGKMTEAKRNLEKARQHMPDYPPVLLGYAYFYEQVDELDLAEQYYLKAMKLDKRYFVLNNYAVFLCKNKRFSQAQNYYQQILSDLSSVNYADVYENMGLCFIMEGDKLQAIDAFDLAIKYDYFKKNAWYQVSKIYYDLQNYEKSLYYAQRYLKLFPLDEEILHIYEHSVSFLGVKNSDKRDSVL